MGNFAFTKADNLTNIANIPEGSGFKFLIPKEYGGGFIKDKYRGYGDLGKTSDSFIYYDMYELLAQWNRADISIKDEFKADANTDLSKLKEVDKYTDDNRSLGIDLSYGDMLPKYPLKLVSPSCNLSYEEVQGISLPDPTQGWSRLKRDSSDFRIVIERYVDKYSNNCSKELINALMALPR